MGNNSWMDPPPLFFATSGPTNRRKHYLCLLFSQYWTWAETNQWSRHLFDRHANCVSQGSPGSQDWTPILGVQSWFLSAAPAASPKIQNPWGGKSLENPWTNPGFLETQISTKSQGLKTSWSVFFQFFKFCGRSSNSVALTFRGGFE